MLLIVRKIAEAKRVADNLQGTSEIGKRCFIEEREIIGLSMEE